MDPLRLTQAPVARTGMLIRKPVRDVFRAFIDPKVTTRFWFTKSSGPLEAGGRVQWDGEMYGVSVPVIVRAIEPDRRILIEWGGEDGRSTVEWRFRTIEGGTFVDITNSGFEGSGDEQVKQATDSTQGFTFVLAGLKALLEHDVELNLVPDRFPKGLATE